MSSYHDDITQKLADVIKKMTEVEAQYQGASEILKEMEIKKSGLANSDISARNSLDIKKKQTEVNSLQNEITLLRNEKEKLERDIKNIIPFTNRERELDNIIASAEPTNVIAKYFIIDAPAGFGKTVFMEELHKRFSAKKNAVTEKKWYSRLVKIDSEVGIQDFYKQFAQVCGVDINLLNEDNYGYQLANAWVNKFQPHIYEGLILLFDLDKQINNSILKFLVEKFIPNFHSILFDKLSSYQKGELVFRVVVSGRHLSRNTVVKNSNLKFSTVFLSIFDYDVITRTIQSYISHLPPETASELAAHALFFTGGHPGCIGELLVRYKEDAIPTNKIGEYFNKSVWKDIVSKYAEEVVRIYSSKADFAEVETNLQFLRYISDKALRDFVKKYNLEKSEKIDFVLLTDAFYGNELFIKDELNFWVDTVARRLMIMWYRHENENKFNEYCINAQNLSKELVSEDRRYSAKWLLEYIFQELQKLAFEDNENKRSDLRKHIFDNLVLNIAEIFTNRNLDYDDMADECRDLIALISSPSHWEFRFLFNYHLRAKYYNDEPIERLRQYLSERFEMRNIGR